MHNNYALHSNAIYLAVGTSIESKTDRNVLKVTERIFIDLN